MKPLNILQHALGLDQYGQGRAYRNHFVTTKGADDWKTCTDLVSQGLMVRHGPSWLYGGESSYCFLVTPAGEKHVRDHSPKPPKLTRSQKRYRDYLRQDSGLTFGEWLQAGYWRPI
jgi:hypothetical protein